MEKLIDIQKLAKMPMTDEFLYILGFPLFKRPNEKKYCIVDCEEHKIIYRNEIVTLEIHSDGRLFCYMTTTTGVQPYPVLNGFQIVRYIEDYLVAPFGTPRFYAPIENKLQMPDIRRILLVRAFIEKYNITPLWCDSSSCACIGCVNKSIAVKKLWEKEYPKLEFLTENDIEEYNKNKDLIN